MMMQVTEKAGKTLSPSAFWAKQVAIKLKNGTYPMRDTSCLCGEVLATVVSERDRYGIPHTMRLCHLCGLIYASPRMTEKAYEDFYASEYRKIYDTPEDSTPEQSFQTATCHAGRIEALLQQHSVSAKSVIDIGCNAGGHLQYFQNRGCTVYGVDYDRERVQYGQAKGLHIDYGGLERLLASGHSADLIILNHVLEHFLNPINAMEWIRTCLTAEGVVYVEVPGLYTWAKDMLWQNAHVFQFTQETLTYVMECSGFSPLSVNEDIVSLWKKSAVRRGREDYPKGAFQQALEHLQGTPTLTNMPIVKGKCKFSLEERMNNLQSCMSRKLPDISALEGHDKGREAVVVSGGPSVNAYLPEIKFLSQEHRLMTIDRMYFFSLLHLRTPDYVVCVDAAEDVIQNFFSHKSGGGATFLFSNTIRPEVFDAVGNDPIYIFNTHHEEFETLNAYQDPIYEKVTRLNAGTTVTIASLGLAMLLGMRTIHLFGFDCHVEHGKYASDISGAGTEDQVIRLQIGKGDDAVFYNTTMPFLCFAQQFLLMEKWGKDYGLLDDIVIYGDSLVKAIRKS